MAFIGPNFLQSDLATTFAAPSVFESAIGKKLIMAVTGGILFLFVVAHMLGNLQIYLGARQLDAYARGLSALPVLLWGARCALLLCVVLHVTCAIQLSLANRRARPQAYVKKSSAGSSYASRTMMWSGPMLFLFIVYHLLHFTTGHAHPDFREGMVYRNVITGFQNWPASLVYIAAMAMLGLHLYHGAWSMFQSAGVSHPRYTPLLKLFAAVASGVLTAGNISIPIAVLMGVLR